MEINQNNLESILQALSIYMKENLDLYQKAARDFVKAKEENNKVAIDKNYKIMDKYFSKIDPILRYIVKHNDIAERIGFTYLDILKDTPYDKCECDKESNNEH